MRDLTTLIAKLEVAQIGSRELDAEIAVAIFSEPSPSDDLIYAKVPHADERCVPGTYWRHSRSGASLRTAPEYTAEKHDLTAAMELVPDNQRASIDTDGGLVSVEILRPRGFSTAQLNGFCERGDDEISLALVTAALKALELLEKSDD